MAAAAAAVAVAAMQERLLTASEEQNIIQMEQSVQPCSLQCMLMQVQMAV
jgi:hypothetical protein